MGELPPQLASWLRGKSWVYITKLVGLGLNCRDDRGVLVTEIYIHELGVEIQDSASIVVNEI